MIEKIRKIALSAVLLALAVLYVIKFGGPQLLKMYVQAGIGNCQSHRIFCVDPDQKVATAEIDKEFVAGLKRYEFEDVEILLPKNLKAVKGESEKFYYKKRPWLATGGSVFLVSEPPDYFVNLFPDVKKRGIVTDYQFIEQIMVARFERIDNAHDAFFVVMKSLFTPDLGPLKNIRIVRFTIADKRGFISYSLGPSENYFDCNVFDKAGNYFAVYIRDTSAKLDLSNVLSIISTLKKRI